jgi:hypothetical protein
MAQFERRQRLTGGGSRAHAVRPRAHPARSSSLGEEYPAKRKFAGNQATQHWLRSVFIQGRLTGDSLADEPERETDETAGAAQNEEQMNPAAEQETEPDAGGINLDDLTITGEAEGAQDAGAPAQTPAPPAPTASGCPYTAELMGFVLGEAKQSCKVPAGYFGASRLAQFRVRGAPEKGSLTIGEQFTALDDPYGVVSKLKPNSYTTTNGRFDDCYSLYSKSALPEDFILKVEQNHLINGQIISKNEIIYRADSIRACGHPRAAGSCDFSKRCK